MRIRPSPKPNRPFDCRSKRARRRPRACTSARAPPTYTADPPTSPPQRETPRAWRVSKKREIGSLSRDALASHLKKSPSRLLTRSSRLVKETHLCDVHAMTRGGRAPSRCRRRSVGSHSRRSYANSTKISAHAKPKPTVSNSTKWDVPCAAHLRERDARLDLAVAQRARQPPALDTAQGLCSESLRKSRRILRPTPTHTQRRSRRGESIRRVVCVPNTRRARAELTARRPTANDCIATLSHALAPHTGDSPRSGTVESTGCARARWARVAWRGAAARRPVHRRM